VPVLINDAITLKFTVDSGAADVSIPADVVMTLIRTGTLLDNDFLGSQTYILADGTQVPSQTFRIRTLKVGDRILENVTGSIAPIAGSLLLGQSFLSRFKGWSIDNEKGVLTLLPVTSAPTIAPAAPPTVASPPAVALAIPTARRTGYRTDRPPYAA
jgi:hypothetical protein